MNRTFEEVTAILESRVNYELQRNFTLEGMETRLEELRILLEKLGHPETKYRTVHVAGTKGKGSTCVLLESVLREHGLNVGRYSSPHLYTVRERFAVNGTICSIPEFTEGMSELCDRVQKINPALFPQLTYFELITLFAFEYFARKQVDIAVLETGMGGRLDATNTCRPELTIITSISFDHIEQLGPTLADIAAEKGGIIKEGVPLLSAVRRREAQEVLHRLAQTRNVPEYFLTEAFTVQLELPLKEKNEYLCNAPFCFQTLPERFPADFSAEHLTLTLPGFHQIRNASLAAAAALLLLKKVDSKKLRDGLRNAVIPVRIEIFPAADGKPAFVADGAHNHSSIRAFIVTVRQRFPQSRIFAVFGTSLGKDVERMLSDLILFCDCLVLTQFSNNLRAFPAQGLKTIVSSLPNAPQKLKDEFYLPETEDGDGGTIIVYIFQDDDVASLYAERMGQIENLTEGSDFVQSKTQIEVIDDCRAALQFCQKNATANDVICVTGSLFLAAELRKFHLENFESAEN